jgi:fatty acid desaturase
MGRVRRALLRAHNTLLGRLVLGPLFAYVRLAVGEVRRLQRHDYGHLGHWLVHVPAVAAVLYWVVVVCGIPVWVYVLGFAYPGLSLTMLRSFAEHRPAREPACRTAVVEAGPLMRLLYLNNTLHASHHARPELPWYELPAHYRAHRAEILAANGGYLFRGGYLEQVRRFLVRPKDEPVHPLAAAIAP